MQPATIPMHLESHHRIEKTVEDRYREGSVAMFHSEKEAVAFAAKVKGFWIHDSNIPNVWYVLPLEFQNALPTLSSMESD